MSLKIAWLGAAISLVIALASGGSASAQSAAGIWDMQGSATVRGAGIKETLAVTGVLTLDVGRTYTWEVDGDPLVEVGVWFQDGSRIILHTTNLLELVMAIEDELSVSLGEPVEIVPIKWSTVAGIDPRSGLLSIRDSQVIKAILLSSGMTLSLRTSTRLTGTPVP